MLSFIVNKHIYYSITIFKDFYLLISRERKGRRKTGRETLMCERNLNSLPLARPQLGTWPATQARALIRN